VTYFVPLKEKYWSAHHFLEVDTSPTDQVPASDILCRVNPIYPILDNKKFIMLDYAARRFFENWWQLGDVQNAKSHNRYPDAASLAAFGKKEKTLEVVHQLEGIDGLPGYVTRYPHCQSLKYPKLKHTDMVLYFHKADMMVGEVVAILREQVNNLPVLCMLVWVAVEHITRSEDGRLTSKLEFERPQLEFFTYDLISEENVMCVLDDSNMSRKLGIFSTLVLKGSLAEEMSETDFNIIKRTKKEYQ